MIVVDLKIQKSMPLEISSLLVWITENVKTFEWFYY